MGRLSDSAKQDNSKFVIYVKKVKENGDEDAFRAIAKALHAFLLHLSSRKFYRISGNSSEDVYQEGLMALATKAIPDYREEKGAFLAFAKLCIRRHIITILKSANNNKNKALNDSISFDAKVSDEEDGPVTVAGFINTNQENIVSILGRLESHCNLKYLLLKKLTKLEAKVLEYYLQNFSYQDIVVAMNRHKRGRNRVKSKVIDNALCRIKNKALEIEAEMKIGRRKGEW